MNLLAQEQGPSLFSNAGGAIVLILVLGLILTLFGKDKWKK